MTQAVIILNNGSDEDFTIIGPFAHGEEASRYGFNNLPLDAWYWLPCVAPAPAPTATAALYDYLHPKIKTV